MIDESLVSKVIAVLREAPWPMPTDELARRLKDYPSGSLSSSLSMLKYRGRVKQRISPDDRRHAEWWLTEQEDKHKLHLSINGVGQT